MGFKFQGFDLLHLDSSFSEDELLVRKTARDFVEDNLVPIIEECFRTERFPRELVPIMGELGFFGANLEGYGCAGMSNVEYGLVMQELERGDSGFRSFVSVQSGLVMYPIYTFGSDEQKNTWLPALASGEKLGCFGLTEPGAGSNPGAMTTTARKVGDEYVLNGEKLWITSGTIADVAIVFAKVEDEGGKIRGFLIETNRPGFSAYDVHGKWSLRASHTSGLSLQDVHVPLTAAMPGALEAPIDQGGTEAIYEVRMRTSADRRDEGRELLDAQLDAASYPVQDIEAIEREQDEIEFVATLSGTAADPHELDEIVARLESNPMVQYAGWSLRTTE